MVDIKKCRTIVNNVMKDKWLISAPTDEISDSILILNNAIDELEKYQNEANKIIHTCSRPCHMGKNMKLIEREYNEGYEPYGTIVAQYECQLRECPKICPRYKTV